jgi:hypothetical protein
MLAVGTSYEHYTSVWVKNEWSRYLKLLAQDKGKHLIPCYKDIDPEDIPKEFNHLQGADLGKMGAIQDILFNMEKYIPLLVKAPTMIANAEYVIYRHGLHSLMEIVFDAITGAVHKVCLPVCEKHQVYDVDYLLPANHTIGDVLVERSNDITTDTFVCEIYRNAVKVKLHSGISHQVIATGNLVWELDAQGNLISLVAYDLKQSEIDHVLKELD